MSKHQTIKRRKFWVPIFEVSVTVVVTPDIPQEYKRIFDYVIPDDNHACVGYERSKFALLINPAQAKKLDWVAHELFHLTHRILEYRAANFDERHHEVAAMLHGWLTEKIFKILEL